MQPKLDVPDNVGQALDGVVAAAQSAFGESLRSVVLYGSAAEGKLRASSDVNLLFVLSHFDSRQANDFREIFRFAQSAVNLTSMFVLEEELPAVEEAFAQKFADIRRRHVILQGREPFGALTIPRSALVRRVQQVLLNLTIRMREMYIERSLREEQCAITVAEAAGPLRTSAASIVELEKGEILPPKEALQKIVRDLGRSEFEDLLSHLSEAREHRALPAGQAATILFQTLELVRAVHQRSLKL